MNALILITPCWDFKFDVHINAPNFIVGAMLEQNNTCGECNQPISYALWLFNNAKWNYTTIEQETLAVVYALHKFQHYLLNNKFLFYVIIWLWFTYPKTTSIQLYSPLAYSIHGIWYFNSLWARKIICDSWCFIMNTKYERGPRSFVI
jgi:hypothetical protein